MNNNSLESKVVSYKSARKMSKLGWRKETVFCWVKLKGQKTPKLCHCNLKNDEQFYTVGDYQLIPFWDIENWCYAPLFCEVWSELPNKIHKDYKSWIMELDYGEIGYYSLDHSYGDLTSYPIGKQVIVEPAGKLWTYLKEQGYIKEV